MDDRPETDEYLGNSVWKRPNGTYYSSRFDTEPRELNASQALFLASMYDDQLEMWKRIGGQKLLYHYMPRLIHAHREFCVSHMKAIRELEDATTYTFDDAFILMLRNGGHDVWYGGLSEFSGEGGREELKRYVDKTFPIE